MGETIVPHPVGIQEQPGVFGWAGRMIGGWLKSLPDSSKNFRPPGGGGKE